jgi:hypothetical protein
MSFLKVLIPMDLKVICLFEFSDSGLKKSKLSKGWYAKGNETFTEEETREK